MPPPFAAPARIGFLWPCDGRNDDEFQRCLPAGAALLTARYRVSGALGVAALEADAKPGPLAAAADLLRLADVAAAALGDCAAGFVRGPAHERALIDAVSRTLGRPTASMCDSIAAALRALGAGRVALVAPYPEPVAARLAAYFAERGFAVVRTLAVGLADEEEIGARTAEDWRGTARLAVAPDAEAVVLGGGGVRAIDRLEAMEEEFGRPVVAGPAALMWRACGLAGVDATRPGCGRLFAECGAAGGDA